MEISQTPCLFSLKQCLRRKADTLSNPALLGPTLPPKNRPQRMGRLSVLSLPSSSVPCLLTLTRRKSFIFSVSRINVFKWETSLVLVHLSVNEFASFFLHRFPLHAHQFVEIHILYKDRLTVYFWACWPYDGPATRWGWSMRRRSLWGPHLPECELGAGWLLKEEHVLLTPDRLRKVTQAGNTSSPVLSPCRPLALGPRLLPFPCQRPWVTSVQARAGPQ